jgi:hypothetical protein
MEFIIDNFISKYRSLSLPNNTLSREGSKVDKAYNILYSREIALPDYKMRALAILLQNVNLSIFSDEELETVGLLNLDRFLNDSIEKLCLSLSNANYIFYESDRLRHITQKELKDKFDIQIEDIKELFCIEKTSVDNFIIRVS